MIRINCSEPAGLMRVSNSILDLMPYVPPIVPMLWEPVKPDNPDNANASTRPKLDANHAVLPLSVASYVDTLKTRLLFVVPLTRVSGSQHYSRSIVSCPRYWVSGRRRPSRRIVASKAAVVRRSIVRCHRTIEQRTKS
jgi:hypothetical protein